ncbi:DUF2569 family protein [Qipengyuania zhejiangensis]|uniref:DUF2569 family protein n=1 Tax=Qipengyuania zhejiangensis TaxID=3077782 RepID=UPI002D79179F|nr:DUF2569 domain-containing protein [Qipengyuania sp. Z2]
MIPRWHSLGEMIARYLHRFDERSKRVVAGLRPFLDRALPWWITGWLCFSLLKVVRSPSPIYTFVDFAAAFLPYTLIALAPTVALRLAERAFPAGEDRWAPRRRIALAGRWRPLDRADARRHPLFGPTGIMASLLVGLLLNVVLRSGEFLLAMPAMSAMAPDWARTLFLVMAFENMAMNFLYIVCFVMALRAVPMFPRMLVLTWLMDIGLQLTSAHVVHTQPALPPDVAQAMLALLQGNVTKVLVSVFIWLPYLLVSERVNVTYRSRVST